ncbi:MAG: flagellar protein FlaG [Methylophilaceae bacterium]|uniref:flagellar protein FlaG n=1 Tax=Methylovorus sp. MM2 TaxID=1848038 RepID=UPI0007E1FDC6|nr:flagellar protein FlaG [Methylovorus sp. MM2]OAM51251.1 hypothetical protein A7981_10980 [Methylovorus sp. MM2]
MSISSLDAYSAARAMVSASTSVKPTQTATPTPPPTSQVAAVTNVPATQSKPISDEELSDAVQSINEFVTPVANSITFSIDKDTGRTIVKVIDKHTQEVIRQIPDDEVLAISKALDKLQGLLLKQTA